MESLTYLVYSTFTRGKLLANNLKLHQTQYIMLDFLQKAMSKFNKEKGEQKKIINF